MAKKKYYVGDLGPMLFDDGDSVDDQDGDFAGEDRVAFRTDGSMRASGADDHEDSLVKKSTHDATDAYARSHGSEHMPAGGDSIPTKVVTVVTGVDFVAETVTTEDITVFDV